MENTIVGPSGLTAYLFGRVSFQVDGAASEEWAAKLLTGEAELFVTMIWS
jgi:hypothetical protein